MDTVKKHWIPIAVSTGVAISLVLVYLRLSKKGLAIEVGVDNSGYKEFVDQRASQSYKNDQGLQWLKKIIENQILIEGQPLKLDEDSLLKREDLNKIMKIMEIMAKISLYEIRHTH